MPTMPPLPNPTSVAQGLASTEPDSNYYDYTKDVDENLNCPICRCPFVDPVTCDIGEHVFCRPCITRALEVSPTCPIDRAPLGPSLLQPAPRLIQQMLEELPVFCPHADLGCKHTGQRHLLSAHLKDECSWSEMGCACSRECGRKVRKRDMERHLKECPHRIAPCQECGAKIKAIELEAHQAKCPAGSASCPHCQLSLPRALLPSHFLSCPSHPIPCPHARFGCSHTGPRRLVEDDHLLTCPYEGIKDFFMRYEERLDALDWENRMLRTKLEDSERKTANVHDAVEGCRLSLGPYFYPAPSPGMIRRQGGSRLGIHSPAESGFFSARDSTGTSFEGLDLASHGWTSPSSVWQDTAALAAALGPFRPNPRLDVAQRSSSLTSGATAAIPVPPPLEASPEQPPIAMGSQASPDDEGTRSSSDDLEATETWHPPNYRPSVPPRVSSRPPPVPRPEESGASRSAFPDSYTPVSAFPSLRPPTTPATVHPLSSRTPFAAATQSGEETSGTETNDEPDGARGPSTSVGDGLHTTHPGSLTSTLASLAASLSNLLSHAERSPSPAELADLRTTVAAAARETVRLQDEMNLLRASLHGVRMNVSMLMMDRRNGEGAGGLWGARPGGPMRAASVPEDPQAIIEEEAGPSRMRGLDSMTAMREALEEAAHHPGAGMPRRWGQAPPGFVPPLSHSNYPHPAAGWMRPEPVYGPPGMFRRFGGRLDIKL